MHAELAVVIPTRDRPEKLRRCLSGLIGQDGLERSEVFVTVDGPSGAEQCVVDDLAEAGLSGQAGALGVEVLDSAAPAGPAAARNRALERVTAPSVLLLNDDVVPGRGLLRAHVGAHRELDTTGFGAPAMVLGSAPFAVEEPDRLFDRLIRETSMVFFYDQMIGERASDPMHDWGFRHAWTLNLSVSTEAARHSGGFDASLPAAAFEDLEWAWRLSREFGSPVLYRPEAQVVHHHRYEPAGYLEREIRLGQDAVLLARANPRCAEAIFGRDVLSEAELDYSRAFVERERSTAERLRRSFESLADVPAESISDPRLITLVYEQHVLLKRWCWRQGLIEAHESRAGVGQAACRASVA